MKALIQRVQSASVTVNNTVVGQIDQGLLVLLGVEPQDSQASADKILRKILAYRMFSDQDGKMNLSLNDTGGGLLLVSQFTLVADTRKGNRPSFTSAAPPAQAEALYDYLCAQSTVNHSNTEFGVFGADMQVALVNDGPVTFLLEA